MPIEVGAEAPDFTLQNQDKQDFKLSDHRGQVVVLLWYPLDWSPTCDAENCRISQEPVLGDSAMVFGISRDSVWSHKAFKEARGIKHDLLADPTLEVTKMYGLQHPKVPFISHRATVVVDRAGHVAFCQVQENTGAERDWEPIKAALADLD